MAKKGEKLTYAKNVSEVQDLNQELSTSSAIIKGMDEGASDLVNTIQTVGQAWSKSKKYSKENLNLAKQQSSAGRDILNVLKAQQSGDKKLIAAAKAKLKLNQKNIKNMDDTTKKMYDAYGIQQKNLEVQEKINKKQGMFGKISGKASGIVAGIGALLKGVITFAIKQIIKLWTEFDKKVTLIGKTFGVMGKELLPRFKELNYQAALLGQGFGDLLSITDTLSTNYGTSVEKAADLSLKIMDTALATGLANEEAAELFGMLEEVYGLSSEGAEDFIEQTYQLAQMTKVNPKAVLKDMAKSTQMIAKFGKANLDSVRRTAIINKQMGLDLATAEKIQGGLLDFQSSINAEMTLEAALGKDVNLQHIRELALLRKTDDMMVEIKKEIDRLGGTASLGYFQFDLMAKAIGGIDPMELRKLSGELEALPPKTEEVKLGFTDLLGEETQGSLTRLSNMFSALGVKLVDEIGPHIEDLGVKLVEFINKHELFDKAIYFVKNFGKIFGETKDKVVSWIGDLKVNFDDLMFSLRRFGVKATAAAKGMAAGAVGGALFGPAGVTAGALLGGIIGWNMADTSAIDAEQAAYHKARRIEQESAEAEKARLETVQARRDAMGLTTKSNEPKKIDTELLDSIAGEGFTSKANQGRAHQGGLTTGDGLVNVQGQEAIIPLVKLEKLFGNLQREMNSLRVDMKSYFDVGGTAANGIGMKVAQEISSRI